MNFSHVFITTLRIILKSIGVESSFHEIQIISDKSNYLLDYKKKKVFETLNW